MQKENTKWNTKGRLTGAENLEHTSQKVLDTILSPFLSLIHLKLSMSYQGIHVLSVKYRLYQLHWPLQSATPFC